MKRKQVIVGHDGRGTLVAWKEKTLWQQLSTHGN